MHQHAKPAAGRSPRRSRWAGVAALSAVIIALPLGAATASAAPTGPHHGAPHADPTTVAYVEVNEHELASVGRYRYADGSPVYDLAIIFAANIDWDGTEAVLSLNDRVQGTLDAAEEQIRPLQAQGI
jgi:hypothetical protein